MEEPIIGGIIDRGDAKAGQGGDTQSRVTAVEDSKHQSSRGGDTGTGQVAITAEGTNAHESLCGGVARTGQEVTGQGDDTKDGVRTGQEVVTSLDGWKEATT